MTRKDSVRNDSVPDDAVPDNTVPDNTLPDDTVTANTLPDDSSPTEPLTAETLFGEPAGTGSQATEPEPTAAQLTMPYPAAPLWSAGAAPESVPRPRIRWAGVVWGALFAAFGIATMSILASTSNQMAVGSWFAGLGPWGTGIVLLVAVGALVLILGILSALSRPARAPR